MRGERCVNGRAYYNEIDKHAADRLELLIDAGLIPSGVVDRRSIRDVSATDVLGFTQCHFFAGIGGWPLALRLAGWPDERPVWSASLPCQPYSVGAVGHGGAKGQEDDRHLLPVFVPLVKQCAPAIIFGEQVASAIKWGWLDEAFWALETLGYACGASVEPALAHGAQHERKRLYWMANAGRAGWARHQPLERLSVTAAQALAVYGDPIAGARRALDGDYSDLLPCDGVSVVLERAATKDYGNAIYVPQAVEFIIAAIEALNEASS